jgi:hypothetical protein
MINHYSQPRSALKGRKGKRKKYQKVQKQGEIFIAPL